MDPQRLRDVNTRWLTAGLIISLVTGCTSVPSAFVRAKHASELAETHNWRLETLTAGKFELSSFMPETITARSELTIYIEGDGLAWISPRVPSTDPTPLNPVALKLALAQPVGNVVYLARPCQLMRPEGPPCDPRYWTSHRFAPDVIDASNTAVDQLKARFGATKLTLVGYSGGAAVAALIAARRSDVSQLVSVAGNLNTAAWSRLHRLTPLNGSMNPSSFSRQLRTVSQLHFAGGKDQNIPPELTKGFAALFPPANRPHVHIEPSFDHDCCWAQTWSHLWQTVVTNKTRRLSN